MWASLPVSPVKALSFLSPSPCAFSFRKGLAVEMASEMASKYTAI